MKILKFGGSSVKNAENINKVVSIIRNPRYKNAIVVLSAMGGITDLLIKTGTLASQGNTEYTEALKELEDRHISTAKSLLPVTEQSSCLSDLKKHFNELEDILEGIFRLKELSKRSLDRLVSFGELCSSRLVSFYLNATGTPNEWLDSRKLIQTNSKFGGASVDQKKTKENIQTALADTEGLFIAPGFIASDNHGHPTTLGRGGSDYTASLYAAALECPELEIWTDVSGMMTADPNWVPNARPIPQISYKEAMELSHFGAKVIYPPTIQPAMKKNIRILVKNTFHPDDEGTSIEAFIQDGEELITGISSINKVSLLSLEGSGMVGIPGVSKRLFEALAKEKINVILITQSSSEHSICAGINAADAEKAKYAVDEAFEYEMQSGKIEPLKIENGLSILALVGDSMKSHTGVAGKMFYALGRNGINIRAIAQGSSERNISAVVSQNDIKKAVNVLHEAFFENATTKQLNLYIAGSGNVGSKLIEQIISQKDFLLKNLNIQLNVDGICNSRKMLIGEDCLNLESWKEAIKTAPDMDLDQYIDKIISNNLRNSVFVDVTASEKIASTYNRLLSKSISVVACNKIAAASPYDNYLKLKKLAREFSAYYLFETNVGAGLPIIGTLNDLRRSGDKIKKIEAVLSGTLNFVFNEYDGKTTFSEVVRQAQAEGYTEPDPRLDLSGTDVMRKIMILARESGEKLELSDIANKGFLPESCNNGDVESFYEELTKHEFFFQNLLNEANSKNCKLKFVATYENGKASVGLQHVSEGSDFYHLYGKDNIVLFYTERYPEQPMVIKGAGAGAEVTASGVFADIIRVAH